MDIYDEVFEFIHDFIESKGYGPSYKEIMEGCNISSKSMVSRYIDTLVEEGAIEHTPGIARSIRIKGA